MTLASMLPSTVNNWLSVVEGSNVTSMTALALIVIFASSRVSKFLRSLHAVNYIPGLRVPFFPLGLPGAALPTTWWNPGYLFLWKWRNTLYKRFNRDTISVVPFLVGDGVLYTSNLDVARQVTAGGHKSDFEKPEAFGRSLLLWGMNLVTANGDVWRKHRRVVGPAFHTKLYQHVWKTSAEVYHEIMTQEGWIDKKVVEIPVLQNHTFKFTLLIIGICGFGFDFNWSDPPRAPDGTMSLQEALRITNDNLLLTALPKWVQKLPFKYPREYREAAAQVMHFMKSQVTIRKAYIKAMNNGMSEQNVRSDAFTMLVKANEDETGKFQLSDEELIGNVYVMLFAGHETTAHTLAATLAFLALHDDVQEEVFEQIVSVVGWDRDPEFDDYGKLDKVLAAFYEALRLFPAGHILIREATDDTVLQVPNAIGEDGSSSVPVSKGTKVIVDMVGVQYNPRYFDEPENYKPSRWYGIANETEAFTAFSVGPRACLGRKFATTEAVCFLALLLRDWRVEALLKDGETIEAWKRRVLDAKILMTLGVQNVSIKFVRRTKL